MVHDFLPWMPAVEVARFVRAGYPGVGGYCRKFRRAFPARLWMPPVEKSNRCDI
jgi:hypothetical protein